MIASTLGHEARLAEAERRFEAETDLMARAAEAAYRDLVGRRGGGEQDGPRRRRMLRQDGLREVVVLAVQEDELDLVVRTQAEQVRERLVRLHA